MEKKLKKRKMKMLKLEFYTLNYDFNRKKVINYNIFQNKYVYDAAVKAVVRYMTGAINYCEYIEAIKKGIALEMHGRVQYEISVNDAFPKNLEDSQKISVYEQVKDNIEVIAQYVYMAARQYFYNEDIWNEWSKPNELRESIWVDEVKGEVFYTRDAAIAAINEFDLEETDGDRDRYIKDYINEYLKNE